MPNTTVIIGSQAMVIQTAPTKLPIFIARDVTVETITSWCQVMILYFLYSETKEDQKTRKAATMLIDPKLQS